MHKEAAQSGNESSEEVPLLPSDESQMDDIDNMTPGQLREALRDEQRLREANEAEKAAMEQEQQRLVDFAQRLENQRVGLNALLNEVRTTQRNQNNQTSRVPATQSEIDRYQPSESFNRNMPANQPNSTAERIAAIRRDRALEEAIVNLNFNNSESPNNSNDALESLQEPPRQNSQASDIFANAMEHHAKALEAQTVALAKLAHRTPVTPPYFTGGLKDDLRVWIRDYERIMGHNGETDFLFYAPPFLRGRAKDWYENWNAQTRPNDRTWRNFKLRIFEEFVPLSRMDDLKARLRKRRFRIQEEPFIRYYQDINNYCRLIDPIMDEHKRANKIVENSDWRKLKQWYISHAKDKTPDQIRAVAEGFLLEENEFRDKHRGQPQRRRDRPTDSRQRRTNNAYQLTMNNRTPRPRNFPNQKQSVNGMDRRTDVQRNFSSTRPKPFEHINRSPPARTFKDIECHNCHRKGHLARDCRTRTSSSYPSRNPPRNGSHKPVPPSSSPWNRAAPPKAPVARMHRKDVGDEATDVGKSVPTSTESTTPQEYLYDTCDSPLMTITAYEPSTLERFVSLVQQVYYYMLLMFNFCISPMMHIYGEIPTTDHDSTITLLRDDDTKIPFIIRQNHPVVIQRTRGKEMKILLDTASPYTIIDAALWKRDFGSLPPARRTRPHVTLFGATGHKIQVIAETSIKLTKSTPAVPTLVCEGLTSRYHITLGHTFFELHNAKLDYSTKRMSLSPSSVGDDPYLDAIRSYRARYPTELAGPNFEDLFMAIAMGEQGPVGYTTPVDKVPLSINPALTVLQKQQLKDVLRQFATLYHNPGDPLGKIDVLKHRITLVDGAKPIRRAPYSVKDLAKRQVIEKQIDEMLKMGVIEKATETDWSSPVLLVPKKNGKLRFCVDYRALNKVTKRDMHPLPRIDDVQDRFAGCKFYSTLDLVSAYWQLEVDERDWPLTTFVTHKGCYFHKRMAFGLTNAPASFQRAIETILGDFGDAVSAYLDDIVIATPTFTDHLKILRAVLRRLSQHGVKLNLEKSEFAVFEAEVLGHYVSQAGIRTLPKRVRAITQYPTPRCVKDLQAFFGLANYERRFIDNFSRIAAPLRELLKKYQPFRWQQAQDDAFKLLKEKLSTAPVLAIFDPNKPCVLITDASSNGLGAVIKQPDEDGRLRPVAYTSRGLTSAERNYPASEQEMLAVVYACTTFDPYLHYHPTEIITDAEALRYILSGTKFTKSRLSKWNLFLQNYTLIPRHRPGAANREADALSRYPVDPAQEIEFPTLMALTAQDNLPAVPFDIGLLRIRQDQDPYCRHLRNSTRHNTELDENGLLLVRRFSEGEFRYLLVIPHCMAYRVTRLYHTTPFGGHFGFRKLITTIRQRFHFKKMPQIAHRVIETCQECQFFNQPTTRPPGNLQPIPTDTPFDRVSLDCIVGLPRSHGNTAIIVAVDYCSKWMEAVAVANITAFTTARFLLEYIYCRHGSPLVFYSDRGGNFVSRGLRCLTRLLRTRQEFTTPRHPQSAGLVERANKTIIHILRKNIRASQRNWSENLPMAVAAYNFSPHSATKISPYQFLYGRIARFPLDLEFNIPPRSPVTATQRAVYRTVSKIWQEHQQTSNTQNYNARHEDCTYTPGDRVLLRCPPLLKGDQAKKLSPSFVGPYQVMKQVGTNTYVLQPLHDGFPEITASIEHLKLYHPVDQQSVPEQRPDYRPTTSQPTIQRTKYPRFKPLSLPAQLPYRSNTPSQLYHEEAQFSGPSTSRQAGFVVTQPTNTTASSNNGASRDDESYLPPESQTQNENDSADNDDHASPDQDDLPDITEYEFNPSDDDDEADLNEYDYLPSDENDNTLPNEYVYVPSDTEIEEAELEDRTDISTERENESQEQPTPETPTNENPPSPQQSPTSSQPNTLYVVEAIRQQRKTTTGHEYLVKWANYDSDDNTWEPESDLLRCVPDMVNEFLAKQPRRRGRPRKILQTIFATNPQHRYPAWPFVLITLIGLTCAFAMPPSTLCDCTHQKPILQFTLNSYCRPKLDSTPVTINAPYRLFLSPHAPREFVGYEVSIDRHTVETYYSFGGCYRTPSREYIPASAGMAERIASTKKCDGKPMVVTGKTAYLETEPDGPCNWFHTDSYHEINCRLQEIDLHTDCDDCPVFTRTGSLQTIFASGFQELEESTIVWSTTTSTHNECRQAEILTGEATIFNSSLGWVLRDNLHALDFIIENKVEDDCDRDNHVYTLRNDKNHLLAINYDLLSNNTSHTGQPTSHSRLRKPVHFVPKILETGYRLHLYQWKNHTKHRIHHYANDFTIDQRKWPWFHQLLFAIAEGCTRFTKQLSQVTIYIYTDKFLFNKLYYHSGSLVVKPEVRNWLNIIKRYHFVALPAETPIKPSPITMNSTDLPHKHTHLQMDTARMQFRLDRATDRDNHLLDALTDTKCSLSDLRTTILPQSDPFLLAAYFNFERCSVARGYGKLFVISTCDELDCKFITNITECGPQLMCETPDGSTHSIANNGLELLPPNHCQWRDGYVYINGTAYHYFRDGIWSPANTSLPPTQPFAQFEYDLEMTPTSHWHHQTWLNLSKPFPRRHTNGTFRTPSWLANASTHWPVGAALGGIATVCGAAIQILKKTTTAGTTVEVLTLAMEFILTLLPRKNKKNATDDPAVAESSPAPPPPSNTVHMYPTLDLEEIPPLSQH